MLAISGFATLRPYMAFPEVPGARNGVSQVSTSAAWLSRGSWAAGALALLVQAYPHVGDLIHNRYAPGSAWEPRVKAILDVSRVATRGGPYLAVPSGSGLAPVDRKVNDLGFSAFAYAWGRLSGRPLNRRLLMGLNLSVLLTALLALLASMPPQRGSPRLSCSCLCPSRCLPTEARTLWRPTARSCSGEL